MNVSFVRGKYLNNFEGQNYNMSSYKSIRFTGYASLRPIDENVPFDVVRLPSLADLGFSTHVGRALSYVANRSIGDAQVLFGLERYIAGSDIVHTADPHYYYSYQSAKLRQMGKVGRLVVTSWETIPFNNESTNQKKKRKYYVMKHADKFICHTNKACDTLIAEGVQRTQIELIPLGVCLDRFNPVNHYKDTPISILFAGRLVKEKGVIEVYSAFKKVYRETGIKIKLHIVGSGPLFNDLVFMREKDRLSEVVIIEKKKYQDMPEVFSGSSFLVVPSRKHPTWEEQYGMVFIEAMASGIPIITTRTGAITEVVANCGLYVAENSYQEIAHAIHTLATDASLRQKIGTMGRQRAEERYNASAVSSRIYELYRSLL